MILRSRTDVGTWRVEDLGSAPIIPPEPCQTLPTNLIAAQFPILRKVSSSLVTVYVQKSHPTHGVSGIDNSVMGLVINPTVGFVVTSRSLIPSTMCNLRIIFAGSVEVPAKKVCDHALGFTVLQYDTSLIQGSMREITFSTEDLKAQDKGTIWGPLIDKAPCPLDGTVQAVGPLIEYSNNVEFYHPLNVDVLHIKAKAGGAGVLLDTNGNIQGLWLPFHIGNRRNKWVGIQPSLLMPVFDVLRKGNIPPECRMLDVELGTILKNDAQAYGISRGRCSFRYTQQETF